MQLSNEEQRFLAKRTRLVRTWRYAGAVLLAMMSWLGLWLFLFNPLLANPFFVMSQLKNDAIPEAAMVLMAAMLPVVVLMCLALAVALLLFAFAAFSTEKKYIRMIQSNTFQANPSRQGHGGGVS